MLGIAIWWSGSCSRHLETLCIKLQDLEHRRTKDSFAHFLHFCVYPPQNQKSFQHVQNQKSIYAICTWSDDWYCMIGIGLECLPSLRGWNIMVEEWGHSAQMNPSPTKLSVKSINIFCRCDLNLQSYDLGSCMKLRWSSVPSLRGWKHVVEEWGHSPWVNPAQQKCMVITQSQWAFFRDEIWTFNLMI